MRAGKTCVNGTRGLHPRRSPQGRSKLAVEELLPRGHFAMPGHVNPMPPRRGFEPVGFQPQNASARSGTPAKAIFVR